MNSNKNLYSVFYGSLIKNGKKTKAKAILDNAFKCVSEKTGLTPGILFTTVFSKMSTIIDIRTINRKSGSTIIPMIVTKQRSYYLISKRFFDSIKENKSKTSLVDKLADEIIDTLVETSSKSVSKRDLIITQAVANRSNLHYRW